MRSLNRTSTASSTESTSERWNKMLTQIAVGCIAPKRAAGGESSVPTRSKPHPNSRLPSMVPLMHPSLASLQIQRMIG